MKNFITIIVAAMLLGSCSNTQTTNTNTLKDSSTATTTTIKTNDTSLSAVSEFLLASSAGDFNKTGQHPAGFREVKMGHILNNNGSKVYFICGQCQLGNQWTPFATVKTSGYEQYLGKQALNFCNDSSVVWEQISDLSSALQARVVTH